MKWTEFPLWQLRPQFLRVDEASNGVFTFVERAEANGISFLCPQCYGKNNGPEGTHRIMCWEPSVSLDVSPGPGRWAMTGEGYDDLSLVAGSSSVHLTSPGGCQAHFFVTKGRVTNS